MMFLKLFRWYEITQMCTRLFEDVSSEKHNYGTLLRVDRFSLGALTHAPM
jgi:hypothetical protein